MVFISYVLTAALVVVCLGLILLVLIQLPKKEAGAGVAFGGAATDALFGAGSGNVLTKVTKYLAGTFFVLSIVLSVLQSRLYHRSESKFRESLKAQQELPAPAPAAPLPEAAPAVPAASSSNLLLNMAAPTNAAPAK